MHFIELFSWSVGSSFHFFIMSSWLELQLQGASATICFKLSHLVYTDCKVMQSSEQKSNLINLEEQRYLFILIVSSCTHIVASAAVCVKLSSFSIYCDCKVMQLSEQKRNLINLEQHRYLFILGNGETRSLWIFCKMCITSHNCDGHNSTARK